MRCAAKRLRQDRTVSTCRASRCAIAVFERPSAAARIAAARCTRANGAVRNDAKAAALQQRLTTHARRWPQITEIKVRWRAGYAYIDAALDNDEGGLQLCRLKDTGLPFGTPEDALDCACGLCLGDPPS